MKKVMIYALILTLVTIIAVGSTYAFFTATVSQNMALSNIETHQLQVRYSGDTEISGEMELVKNKEEGFRRVVSIALGEDSTPASANIYIHLNNITEGFASVALKWEIYEIVDEQEVYIDSGNFLGYESGDRVYMLKKLQLPLTEKKYAIYLWLNGHEAGNEVVGATLQGYIGAETEPVTGDIQ